MQKYLKYILLAFLIAGLLIVIPSHVFADTSDSKTSGLNLDIARRYYSLDSIKQYIDHLSENGGQFLQLHFADDENYGIESDILHQTKENSLQNADGSYTNPITKKRFLSYEEVQEITNYAHSKGIEIIPELDSPGHMWGIRDLIYFNELDDSIFAGDMDSDYANELDMSNPDSLKFMEKLWSESLQAFPEVSRVHLGGDEFSHDDEVLHDFSGYVNALISYLENDGINQVLLWNDAMQEININEFNKNIIVTYWTYSNWDGGPAEEGKLTLPQFLDNGFSVYNYNGYYLYFVPSEDSMTEEAIAYREQDMVTNWNLGMWDNNTGKNTEITSSILGSAMSIWGEDSAAFSDSEIFNASSKQLKNMIRMNQGSALKINQIGQFIATIEEEGLQEADHSQKSWHNFQEALKIAKAALEEVPSDPIVVDEIFTNLENAYNHLGSDPSALDRLVQEVKKKQAGDYLPTSWEKLQTALEKAERVSENSQSSQSEIEQMISELQSAIDALQLKPAKNDLSDHLSKLKKKQKEDYEENVWKEFQKSLATAQQVFDDPNSAQGDIDEAISKLKSAEDELEKGKVQISTSTSLKDTGPASGQESKNNKHSQKTLPKTGERSSLIWNILGIFLLGVTLLGVKKRIR